MIKHTQQKCLKEIHPNLSFKMELIHSSQRIDELMGDLTLNIDFSRHMLANNNYWTICCHRRTAYRFWENCIYPPVLKNSKNLLWSVVLYPPHKVSEFLTVIFLIFAELPQYIFEINAKISDCLHLVIPTLMYLPDLASPFNIFQAEPAPQHALRL